jgi:hypothetical protein
MAPDTPVLLHSLRDGKNSRLSLEHKVVKFG